MSSFIPGDVVMDDVEYLIEEDGVDVNSDTSIILLVEEEPESLESETVDTFSCGTCHETWTDLSEFLDHKKTCQQVVLSTLSDDILEPSTVADVVQFDDNMSTDIFTFDSNHSESYSNASEQFLEVDDEVGEGDVILQLEEEAVDDGDQYEIDDRTSKNSPSKFPLILDDEDFDDDEESFQTSNPYTCTYCGNLRSYKGRP